jgi:GxxExxY protein
MHNADDSREATSVQIGPMDNHSNRQRVRRKHYPEHDYPHQQLTGKIIASSFAVFRAFGYGFLESVYRRALCVELDHLGVSVAQEVRYELFHRGVSVGLYYADVVAESAVIVETKTARVVDPTAADQLLNCLCAARLTLGLLVYFGPTGAQIKRVIRSADGRVTYV